MFAAALQRAAEDTESMQACARAIDQLVQDGDLDDLGMTGNGEMIGPRTELGGDEDVERELAALEKEL